MASKARIAICLLRNDLRLHDNEALSWAFKNADFVVPLYCFDPRHYKGTWHFNLPKTGSHRLKFLLESVSDLRNTLRLKGSNLIVRVGKPEVIVPELVKTLSDVQNLVFHEEVTYEELKVEKALKHCGIDVKTFWGHTLYHKSDLSFSVNNLPDVYTQFRKSVEAKCPVRKVINVDEVKPVPEGLEEGQIPTMEDLGVKSVPVDPRIALNFKGGETVALDRLNHYLWETDSVATYKETRNGMIGADYSTKFSTWLTHGCISPRKIFWEIKQYEQERTANQSTYWVIFELLWRDYFRYVALKYGNQIFYEGGVQNKRIPWKQDKAMFEAWKDGRTGVPYVDANMREMAATGFMSNRGRQNVASFLTKDLKLDWRMGAEWFESQLIDHDVTSNYGNWLYSAGIGNDPREDRKFNMVKQGLDYDHDGEYVRLWVPELEKIKDGSVHHVWTLSNSVLSRAEVSLGETYPNPIVIAPEWSRHTNKKSGRNQGPPQKQNKGIDFYFKGSQKH